MQNLSFSKTVKIGKKTIGPDYPVFIIGEAGVNHNGSIEKAKQLIDTAVMAGVDAVKFQAFKTENLILEKVEKAPYQKEKTGETETQKEMLKKLEISKEQNQELFDYAKRKEITFLSTPFDDESLEELEELGIEAFKIASTDLTNLPFLKRIAKKGKPIILSTGMSYLSEINLALREILPYNKDVVLLQCTANYPVTDEEANLLVLKTFSLNFDMILGYSDHTTGVGASPYSIALGAKVVEKHFTLNTEDIGPDHDTSLNPEQLTNYVQTIRKVEKYMGNGLKTPTYNETYTRKSLQKCLVASMTIKKGETFTESKIVAKRTGGVGISPIYYKDILGKKATRDFKKNEIIILDET